MSLLISLLFLVVFVVIVDMLSCNSTNKKNVGFVNTVFATLFVIIIYMFCLIIVLWFYAFCVLEKLDVVFTFVLSLFLSLFFIILFEKTILFRWLWCCFGYFFRFSCCSNRCNNERMLYQQKLASLCTE